MYIHADGGGVLGTYCGPHRVGMWTPRSWQQNRTGMLPIKSKAFDSSLASSGIIDDLLKILQDLAEPPGGSNSEGNPLCMDGPATGGIRVLEGMPR